MSIRRTGNPTLVYNAAALAEMCAHISQRRLWALDTESDSLYSYYPKICLIQITVPDAVSDGTVGETVGEVSGASGDPRTVTHTVSDYLVDPLRYNDLAPLGEVLADPANEVIMHAAANDISLLQREYGFTIRRVFDTQLAARILGWKQAGLAAILEEHFGVVSNKRMQRTNWGKRPLTPEQIAYAQMDTHYLPALRVILIDELQAADRWEEAQEAFEMLANSNYAERPANDRTFWQMKETRAVPRAATGVLAALWEWRESEAQRRDTPPFKVLSNGALAQLALEQPVNPRGLDRVGGLGDGNAQRYGAALLAAIAEGKRRPLPDLPQPHVRPEQLLERSELARFDALREWRGRAAEGRGVAPDIVFSNDILLEIVRRSPRTPEDLTQIPEIGPWKARTYGPDVIRIVSAK